VKTNSPLRKVQGPVDLGKRAIDAELRDIREIVADTIVEYLDGALAGKEPAEVMPRAGAAEYLCISLGQLDLLCRREHDPIPFSLAGDSRRFFRTDLRDWLKRQRKAGNE
jgi:hypothetical protein